MTRDEKIEALAEEYDENATDMLNHCRARAFKAGILAGIKLRDEELLAMEFDEKTANLEIDRVMRDGDVDHWGVFNWAMFMARWQFEQFMKAIKGDGDGV